MYSGLRFQCCGQRNLALRAVLVAAEGVRGGARGRGGERGGGGWGGGGEKGGGGESCVGQSIGQSASQSVSQSVDVQFVRYTYDMPHVCSKCTIS